MELVLNCSHKWNFAISNISESFFFLPQSLPHFENYYFHLFFQSTEFDLIWIDWRYKKKKHFDSQWIYCFWPTKNYVHFEALNISEKIKVMDCCSRQKKTEAWKCRWLPFQNDIRYICINQAVRMSESEIL